MNELLIEYMTMFRMQNILFMFGKLYSLLDRRLNSKRGTITFTNIVIFIIAIMTLSWFASPLTESLANFKASTTDPVALMLADLVPAFLLAALIVSLFTVAGNR